MDAIGLNRLASSKFQSAQIGQSSPDLQGFIPFVPAAESAALFLPLYSFLYI